MKKRGKLKGKSKIKNSGSRKVESKNTSTTTATAAAAATSTTKKQYRRIRTYVKEIVDGGNSNIVKVTVLKFNACFELDDETTRQIIYAELLRAGVRPHEIKEGNVDEYTEPKFEDYTLYYKPYSGEKTTHKNKHVSDLHPTGNDSKEKQKQALDEVLVKMSGDSLQKLLDTGEWVNIKSVTRDSITYLSSRAYKQSRIDAAMQKAGSVHAKELEKLNKEYEKSRNKAYENKEDIFKSIARDRRIIKEQERLIQNLGSIEHLVTTYYGGPFMLIDPQFWKDQFARMAAAMHSGLAVFNEALMKSSEEKIYKKLEEIREKKSLVMTDKREVEAKARIDENNLLREELTEEKLKEKALNKIKREVDKTDGDKTEEEKQVIIKNKFNEELEKISEMKLAKSGAFERVAAMGDRDNLYQPAIDALNRTDLEIYKKKYEASKKGDTEKVKELEGLAEKVKEEKSRLHQQRNTKNYDKNEKPETEEEIKYIKSLGDNKEKGYEKIVSLMEKEEIRLFNLPKDETLKEEAPVLKDEPKKPEPKPEPKTDKKEEKKPDEKPKEIKQEAKNSEIKQKETPRSEKEPERDNLTLEEEMKALRGSKEPLKAYHSVYDEDNMMNDLQDQGLSREEARAKTDEFYEKFDEEQRQKELLKDQPKEKKEDKIEVKPEVKVETKHEVKPEPKVEPKPEPKPEPKSEPKQEPKFENKIDKKEDNKPVEAWKREDFLRDLREARDFLESFADLNEKVQESYENSSLKDENEWVKKNDLDNVRQDLKMINNMIEEIKETIPKERNTLKAVDDMGSVFERKEEIGSVFEKPKVNGEIDMSRFKDMKANFGLIEKALRETYKPKIEPLKKERLTALSKPRLDAKKRRDKLEQNYKDTVGKEKEMEKQEAKKQEELKKQKQEQEKKDKTKELKPKTAPEIGGPSGLGR